MPCPHAAAVAAQLRPRNPTATPDDITRQINCLASSGKISGLPSDTPNKLLFNRFSAADAASCLGPAPPAAPAPAPTPSPSPGPAPSPIPPGSPQCNNDCPYHDDGDCDDGGGTDCTDCGARVISPPPAPPPSLPPAAPVTAAHLRVNGCNDPSSDCADVDEPGVFAAIQCCEPTGGV